MRCRCLPTWLLLAVTLAGCKCRDERAIERTMEEAIAWEASARGSPRQPADAGRRDDPRGRDDRPADRLDRTPAPWRPYRMIRTFASQESILLSYESDTASHLVIAQADRPDRSLVEAPASNVLEPLALDDRFVYFNHHLAADSRYERERRFRRIPRNGGKIEALGASAGRVALAADWIYWSTGGGRSVDAPPSEIHGRHRLTGAVTRVRAPQRETVMAMAVLGDQLHVIVQEQPERSLDLRPGRLLALQLDATGAVAPGAAIVELAMFRSDRPIDLAVLDGALYYVTEGIGGEGTLRRWNPETRQGEVLASGLAFPEHLTAGRGHLCFSLMRAGYVRAVLCYRVSTGRLAIVKSSSDEILPYAPVLVGPIVVWSEGDPSKPGRTVSVALE